MSGDNKVSLGWFQLLSQASKTCVMSKLGLKRIHYKMGDEREMVEEWKVSNGNANKIMRDLLGRYWKKRSMVGKEMNWETEIGENLNDTIIQSQNDTTTSQLSPFIRESNSNPMVSSRSVIHCFEWRIRNLPPPGENYKVSVDSSTSSLVVSTKSKKYYKKLVIPDLARLGLPLQAVNLSSSFANRTLVIQYKKPPQVVELEEKVWKEIISPLRPDNKITSPPGCTQA